MSTCDTGAVMQSVRLVQEKRESSDGLLIVADVMADRELERH
jgi:hypothetical protein